MALIPYVARLADQADKLSRPGSRAAELQTAAPARCCAEAAEFVDILLRAGVRALGAASTCAPNHAPLALG